MPMMIFLGRVALFVGVVGLAIAAWQVSGVLLLLFGGFIFASIFAALANQVGKVTHAGHKVNVAISVGALAVAVVALVWLIGDSIAAQLDTLHDSLPRAVGALQGWLKEIPFGRRVLQLREEASAAGISWDRVASAAGLTLGALADSVLMLLIGVFVAAEPKLYKDGFVRLVSPSVRSGLADALDDCATALRNWLKGQAVSMLFVGIATAGGLALLDVPLALTLGLLAGLFDFVPFFGPIAAGVLAVLFAFTEGPQTALYVAVLMLAIQQVEGNLLMPLVQRWAVQLPPMLGLISVVIFAGWFGIAGIIFATPLMVVVMVLLRKLYVEDFLERRRS